MATGPAWLFLAVKVTGRNSEYVKDMLYPGRSTGTQLGTQLAQGRGTRRGAKRISDLIVGAAGGAYDANMFVTVTDNTGTYPTGNVACVQANASGDTVIFTFGALTVTLTEGATGENGFARGASNTTCAANLAACINAHTLLKGLLTAAGAVGNCGLVAKIPGMFLQDIAMSTSDATAFTFTQLTGGAEGAAKIFPQQMWSGRNP